VSSPHVVVVGSINADVVQYVDSLPVPGETVHARRVSRSPGGKGANQACAAAVAGARVDMVGCIGADHEGVQMRTAMIECGVGVPGVRILEEVPTGSATVTVDSQAENTIVISAGANAHVDSAGLPADLISGADVVLMQLEIPLATVRAAAQMATGSVIVNAAPAARLPAELLELVDVLVVNESELRCVTGGSDTDRPEQLISDVRGPGVVIVTLGARGALIRQGEQTESVDAPTVVPVDTTGAGDRFCGELAAALAAGESVIVATRRAVRAASRSVRYEGARGYIGQG
jgi:ribokinase